MMLHLTRPVLRVLYRRNSLISIIVIALFILGACNAAAQSFNSAADLKAYLDKQPANTPDKPIKVAMKANDTMIGEIVGVIKGANKYVSLNLSGSPLTAIPNWAFENCTNLTSVTMVILDSSKSAEVGQNDSLWVVL